MSETGDYIRRSLFLHLNVGVMFSTTAIVIFITSLYHSARLLYKERAIPYALFFLGSITGFIAALSTTIYYFSYNVPCGFQAYMALIAAHIVPTTCQFIALLCLYRLHRTGIISLVAGSIFIIGKFVPWAYCISRYPHPVPTPVGVCASLHLPPSWYIVIGFEVFTSLAIALIYLVIVYRISRFQGIPILKAVRQREVGYFIGLGLFGTVILLLTLIDAGNPSFFQLPYEIYWIFTSKFTCEALIAIHRSAPFGSCFGEAGSPNNPNHPLDPSASTSNFSSHPRSGVQTGMDKSYGAYQDDQTRLSDTFQQEVQLNSVS
ncbi:hypothetical protein BJ684DRAFT_20353 [Piptocephalis cylindrospora]|uniref:Uncharacterized protein n=1 Tax=Piptocephalis cylindrospora TaxID=1907219 RepID=A0A4P9Y3D2_9FUNG|nr:hypothetical protein BJ684DRAFT_20351 [Piptocephalis cylindrospora]RKP13142.1 hypothetical protein BJ684DRAFT_20353 [Piptocephalis cylindrospora]|eukprot:RKP13139.1 hypothetical protein BJ684DRAFT_20351 [Piptocephalis cylindrospora]